MPHRILEDLLVGADHLFHPHAVLVDLKGGDYPHILGICDKRTLININLFATKKKKEGDKKSELDDARRKLMLRTEK